MKVAVLVFIPANTQDLRKAVEEAMAPFDCELEIEEIEEKCSCVGQRAEEDAKKATELRFGPFEEISERFNRENADWLQHRLKLSYLDRQRELTEEEDAELLQLDAEFEQKWKAARTPYEEANEEALARHPLRDLPDPECQSCDGKGTRNLKINPYAGWDYWSLGWNNPGFFEERAESEPATRQPWGSPQKSEFEGNTLTVRDIPKLGVMALPYAVVVDEQWHDLPFIMGRRREREELMKEAVAFYTDLIEKHPDDLAVACKVHI